MILIAAALWVLLDPSGIALLGFIGALCLAGGWWQARKRLRVDQQKLATIIWALADQLGYSAQDLQLISGHYTASDWQNTKPTQMRFYPSILVMRQLIHDLKRVCSLKEAAH